MKFENDFKDAIRDLDIKEKDKLLLRLLKKDRILAARLQFELLGYESREERRDGVEQQVRKKLNDSAIHFSIDTLLKQLRVLTKTINEHVKITSDKPGEVYLDLLLINETLLVNNERLQKSWWNRTDKLFIYIVNRILKILVQVQALHEDYLADFREDIEKLSQLLEENEPLLQKARYMGLDPEWLNEGEIPSDIKEIVAALRKAGKLKG